MVSPQIKVESVDKVYRIWSHPRARLTGSLASRLANSPLLPGFIRRPAEAYSRSVFREFFALKNVSFEINPGETIGIIGRNGSGKSTTLKIIAGTLPPTHGKVSVNGRVAAMLELGSGFEQEFTGRENVFLSAAILGLSRQETEERFDQIAEFADIGEFLDQPVKTYSSGMLVRLAKSSLLMRPFPSGTKLSGESALPAWTSSRKTGPPSFLCLMTLVLWST
jgi:ABC-type polysaccharide/polyol phosphate transport system ATPase subunit